jgi:hypothetical protein
MTPEQQKQADQIVDAQLIDLTLPCDHRDIKIRCLGAIYQTREEWQKETESLRAELAEAKAKLEETRDIVMIERGKMSRITAQLLSLQSHNAKLMDALTAAPCSCRHHNLHTEKCARCEALASQPDNELRDRVVKVLKGLQAYGNNLLGVDRHAIAELLSYL